jgi:hypothetical protein
VVFVFPEGSAWVNQQHLEPALSLPVHQQSRAGLSHFSFLVPREFVRCAAQYNATQQESRSVISAASWNKVWPKHAW